MKFIKFSNQTPKMIKSSFLIFFFTLLIINSLVANTSFRLMTYNTLNFDGTSRLEYFQTVFDNAGPDIVVVQEIASESACNTMLTILQNYNPNFVRANFVYDGSQNNMLFYNSSVFSLTSQSVINTTPRDISEYVLTIQGNPIRIYSCHLKAVDSPEDELIRLEAVTILRDHLNSLPENTEFIIAGDMNFYTSSETGYQKFIADETNNIGRADDMSSLVGNWHENYSYRFAHSQSTRTTDIGDGGATGGLDDRFDFIFTNYGMNNSANIEFVESSYTIYGNDGDHYNIAINDGTNSSVPQNVADALYYASDHLPVYADFTCFDPTEQFCFISEYVEGSSNNKYLEIFNGTGTSVDLSSYSVKIYSNGSPTVTYTISLSGTLLNDEVYVLANNQATVWSGTPDQTSALLNFNGDDAVTLENAYGNVDVIGQIGVQQVWGSGDTTTEDHTLRRKIEITEGDTIGSDPFDPTIEWDGFPIDTVSDLGSHENINPTITVIAPNGNENWEHNSTNEISWSSNDFTGDVKIELLETVFEDVYELISSTTNDGSWDWTISDTIPSSANYKIRISNAVSSSPSDESDNVFTIFGSNPTTDLFISEYVEGSSNNKYLEIFNGTGSSVDLSSYSVKIYYNGSTTASSTISLSGTLLNNEVYVLANNQATVWTGTPDQTSYLLNFNGDDAVTLENASNYIDVIGQIGVQQVWGSGDTTTQNHTLVRKAEITEGDTIGSDPFDPAIEWDGFAQDTISDLGSHTFGGGNVSPIITGIQHDPILPNSSEQVTVSADITDTDGTIQNATLFWDFDDTTFGNSINMILTQGTYVSENSIPAQADNTTIYYKIEATDDDNDTTISSTYNYTVQDITEVSIYDIQYTTDPIGNSPHLGETVTTSGIVTATKSNGYFFQDGAGAWNGIFVYDTNYPAIGDYISLTGLVYEYDNLTELKDLSNFTIVSSGNTLPDVTILSTANINSEQYEGVLVQVKDAECTNIDLGYGEWEINDGSGACSVDDDFFAYSPVLGIYYDVTGVLNYSYDFFKIEPRYSDDITESQQFSSPTNVFIERIGNNIEITWNEVTGANSYKIYSSNDPFTGFTLDESGSFDGTIWTASIPTAKKFYYVTAE